jgi:pimeloyl-ACP methyl ester carboxylesterase
VPDGSVTPLPQEPRWFREALAHQPDHRDVEVDGALVHFRAWGWEELPALVLVHGGLAHSGWWDHVAPLLAGHNRVVALDLSGNGDSGRRGAYSMDQWAREIVAVAEAAGPGGRPRAGGPRPVVIGHSLGGLVTATAAAHHGDRLDGIAIIDTPLNDQPPEEERLRRLRRPLRVYQSPREAIDRFAPTPQQDVVLPYVGRHIAEQSLRAAGGGWTWKFDPSMVGGPRPLLRELLPRLRCRAAFIRAQFGMVPESMAETIDSLLGYRAPIVELPDAGHHPMLDQPLPLVTALRMLLMQWSRTTRDVEGSAGGRLRAPAG